ncbi:MAG: extracellular solute-binding protein [Phycisphaerales bacterium]
MVILILVWSGMTLLGVWYVRPVRHADRGVITAFWEMSDLERVASMEADYRAWHEARFAESPPPWRGLPGRSVEDSTRLEQESRFRSWYNEHQDEPLSAIPRLVWATDDNPARRIQIQLFRRWHLEQYGEPIDVITDPGSRDTRTNSVTKPIVQSIGGAGADLIESYGPQMLRALVDSGIALDVTDLAREQGFEYTRCFDASHSSFCKDGRQYGFPANVGYTVLFYHKDLFEQAGLEAPTGGWSFDTLVEYGEKLAVESPDIPGGKRWAIVGLHPWPVSLSNGARFFSDDGTRSVFNSSDAVESFRAIQDLMYEHRIMPSPSDTASMAAAGGFTGGGDNPLYFSAKLTAMTIGGRWEYVTYAESNYVRVIRPALRRRAAGATSSEELERIDRILAVLDRDVLIPLAASDYDYIREVLTDDDRSQLLRIGVAHVPTIDGRIKYTDVGARVALINRKSNQREYAIRFLRFLASESYNEQINQTFDSICGVIEYCVDADGISGPPQPLPGLESFDSPVFVEAMDGAESQQLSPYIGPERLGFLAGQVMDQLMNGRLTPTEAARLIEDRVNRQIDANVARDEALRLDFTRAMEDSAGGFDQ